MSASGKLPLPPSIKIHPPPSAAGHFTGYYKKKVEIELLQAEVKMLKEQIRTLQSALGAEMKKQPTVAQMYCPNCMSSLYCNSLDITEFEGKE